MRPREAWRRWLLAAGPWQGWAVCPALAAAQPEPAPQADTRVAPRLASARVAPPHPGARAAAPGLQLTRAMPPSPAPQLTQTFAAELAPRLALLVARQPTLVLLDLDVCLGIQLAAALFRQATAHPVLLIPRWPYDQAVLPAQPMLETLLREAASLPRRHTRLQSVAFVLDDQRGAPQPGRAADDPRADNRYQLSVADLPNLATLRARGISHIVKLAHTPPAPNAPCGR